MARTSLKPGAHWLAITCLLLLVTITYWPGLRGGYAFDDYSNIVFNTRLHVTTLHWPAWLTATFSSPASDLQRPLAMLTFAANHYFTGLDPWSMKVTNLAIHLVNSVLVLLLVRALLAVHGGGHSTRRKEWVARFVAAAWALHPINLMAVLFIVQRMESLSHTFVFAGLLLYLLGRRRQLEGGNGWGLIIFGLLAGTGLGALAKESAVLLSLYAFLAELCVLKFRGQSGHRDRRLYALFAGALFLPGVIGLIWLLPRFLPAQAYAFRGFNLVERLLTEARVLMDYMHWSIFPSLRDLSLHHDDYAISRGMLSPPSTLVAICILVASIATSALLRNRRPLISVGIAWFLGAHLLTGTVIPLELVYEHRNYFASLGVCLAIADLFLFAPKAGESRRIGAAVATMMLGFFALTTHLRAREWSDPLRFAMTEAAKHPQSPRATYTLGQVFVVASKYDPNSPLFASGQAALERSIKVSPSGILAHSSLLVLAERDTDKPTNDFMWLDMQQRLRAYPIGPQEINALASLAQCARETERGCRFPPDKMIATFEAALSHGPNSEILAIFGDYAYNVLRQPAQTLAMWREARRLNPKEPEYSISLIKLMIALGHYNDARAEIVALRNLGRVGQYRSLAETMELRLRNAETAAKKPTD